MKTIGELAKAGETIHAEIDGMVCRLDSDGKTWVYQSVYAPFSAYRVYRDIGMPRFGDVGGYWSSLWFIKCYPDDFIENEIEAVWARWVEMGFVARSEYAQYTVVSDDTPYPTAEELQKEADEKEKIRAVIDRMAIPLRDLPI